MGLLVDLGLSGKACIVTGATSGIGAATARLLAAEGAQVLGVSRSGEFSADITQPDAAERIVAECRRRFGRVDVLVNNAGVIQVGPAEEMTLEDYEQAMAVHFWGPLYATLAVLPQMRARREGRIVNVSSIGGKIGVPHLVPYSASKFALAGLSDGLRAELAKDGVVVTSVFPGLMRTGSPRNASFKGRHRTEYAWFAISDSLPVSSIGAERAAAQIIEACRRGRAELVITTQAQAAVKFRALFPEATADILGVVCRLLPGPGGIGRARAKGRESESARAPSVLSALGESGARRNNEVTQG
jgi:short-subunit dehydrogenase